MLERRIAFTALTILTLVTALSFSYSIINIFEKNGIFWVLGQVIGFCLLAIVSIFYFIKNIENEFSIKVAHSYIDRDNIFKIMSFSIPLSIGVFFLWMQNQSYRLIIEKFLGSEFLGYFGVGMAIAIAISSSFETIVMQFLFPKMYKNMNDEYKFKTLFSNIINLILPIYFSLAICVSFLAVYLTAILVDQKFSSSYVFLIFGIWVEFFRTSSSLVSNIAHSKMQTRTIILPYALGGIFVAIGTYFATQSGSYALFIPFVLIFGGLLTFCQMLLTMNKIVRLDLRLKSFFSIFIYSLPFCLAMPFYKYCVPVYFSVLISFIFGIYFLYVIYRFIKLQELVV